MEQVIVRPARLEDLELLLVFEQAMIEAERPLDDTIRSGTDVHYYDLKAMIESPEVEVVVAQLGTEIIGSGYARIELSKAYLKHRRHSYLGFMYVVPEHRGKGINRQVLHALEAWSRSRGVNMIELEVYSSNAPALKAYAKAGFDPMIVTMQKALGE